MSNLPETLNPEGLPGFNIGDIGAALVGIADSLQTEAADVAGRSLEDISARFGAITTLSENLALAAIQAALDGALTRTRVAGEALAQTKIQIDDYLDRIGCLGLTQTAESTNSPAAESRIYQDTKEAIVEERTIGDTHFKIALSTHAKANMQALAALFGDCDVVAIESLGCKDDADRRYEEDFYTKVMARNPDPAIIKQFKRGLKVRLPGDESSAAFIYQYFYGTGKRVILLDINEDHPDYDVTRAVDKAVRDYHNSIWLLAPIEEARAALRRSAAAIANEQRIRDPILAEQLKAIPGQVGRARVGVLIGLLHYGVLDSIDSSAERSQDILRRVDAKFGPKAKLFREVGNGENPDDKRLNRIILREYSHDFLYRMFIKKDIDDMDDDEVSRTIAEIQAVRSEESPKRGPVSGAIEFIKDLFW